eukprot:142188-Heterocapsa_arctica.AAC.1
MAAYPTEMNRCLAVKHIAAAKAFRLAGLRARESRLRDDLLRTAPPAPPPTREGRLREELLAQRS